MKLNRLPASKLGRTIENPRCCLVVPAGAEHGRGVEWVAYEER